MNIMHKVIGKRDMSTYHQKNTNASYKINIVNSFLI